MVDNLSGAEVIRHSKQLKFLKDEQGMLKHLENKTDESFGDDANPNPAEEEAEQDLRKVHQQLSAWNKRQLAEELKTTWN